MPKIFKRIQRQNLQSQQLLFKKFFIGKALVPWGGVLIQPVLRNVGHELRVIGEQLPQQSVVRDRVRVLVQSFIIIHVVPSRICPFKHLIKYEISQLVLFKHCVGSVI